MKRCFLEFCDTLLKHVFSLLKVFGFKTTEYTMTDEDRRLLQVDLACRIPHNTLVRYTLPHIKYSKDKILTCQDVLCVDKMYRYKPYLRQISSMTDKEQDELIDLLNNKKCGRLITRENFRLTEFGVLWFTNMKEYECVDTSLMAIVIDYLNANKYDYRGLINKNLAINMTVFKVVSNG